jgi:hypothetical protein
MASDDLEPHWTTIANIAGVIPRGALLSRHRGLEIARIAANDGPAALRAAYSWRPVPSWVADRGLYLVRDTAEALLDHAGDELMRIVRHEAEAVRPPAGMRRLAYLLGVHNKAMGSGLGAALADLPAAWWGEAINACDELGLADVAALLRRLDPEEPDFELTNALYGEYIRLTTGDAGQGDDPIRTALRHRAEHAPQEFGVHEVPPPPPTTPYDELLPTGSLAFLHSLAELAES